MDQRAEMIDHKYGVSVGDGGVGLSESESSQYDVPVIEWDQMSQSHHSTMYQ